MGGGQLGRMLGLAGIPLGFSFTFLEPGEDPPAAAVGEVIRGGHDDGDALDGLAARSDVITYELEGIPAASIRRLQKAAPVWPPVKALEATQDRVAEKALFRRLGIATAEHVRVDSAADLRTAVRRLGSPLLVKARRLGYDGRRQALVDGESQAAEAWEAAGRSPSIAERVVDFDRELSLVCVRGLDGATAFYPLVENRHAGGILRETKAPAQDVPPELETAARSIGARLLRALDHVGVLAVELFAAGDRLLANELAPRVHNSGHWTIEGAPASQFENHLRAIAGLPLGGTSAAGHSRMLNLIGDLPPLDELLAIPGARVHLYGKEPRPGRKLGHVTVTGPDAAAVDAAAARVRRLLPDPGGI